MALSTNEKIKLITAVSYMKTPNTFLSDTFFPDATPFHKSKLAIDIYASTKKVAEPIDYRLKKPAISRRGYTTIDVVPAYFREVGNIDPGETADRTFGDGANWLDGGESPMSFVEREMMAQITEFRNRITRWREYACGQLLSTGSLSYNGKNGLLTADFQRNAALTATLGVGIWWDAAGINPLDTFTVGRRLVSDTSGANITDVILGRDAEAEFLSNAQVVAELDTRRIETGQIVYEPRNNALTYLGRARGIDIWSYSERYTNEAAATLDVIPGKEAIFISRGLKATTEFGLIANTGVNAPSRWYIDEWSEKNPSLDYFSLESAPLPCLSEADATLAYTVLA